MSDEKPVPVSLFDLQKHIDIESEQETVKCSEKLSGLLQFFKTKDDHLLLLVTRIFNLIIEHQIKVYDMAKSDSAKQKS